MAQIAVKVGSEMVTKLVDAGVIPVGCRRVIIDIKMKNLVTIYYETIANNDVLDIVLPILIQESIEIKDGEQENGHES